MAAVLRAIAFGRWQRLSGKMLQNAEYTWIGAAKDRNAVESTQK
jgi:hypothetical protein